MPLNDGEGRSSTFVTTSSDVSLAASDMSLASGRTSLTEDFVPPDYNSGIVINQDSSDVPMSGHHCPLHTELLRSFREWTESQADAMERLSETHQNQLDVVCQQILSAIKEAALGPQDTGNDETPFTGKPSEPDFNVLPLGRLSRVSRVSCSIHAASTGGSSRMPSICEGDCRVDHNGTSTAAFADSVHDDSNVPVESAVIAANFASPGNVTNRILKSSSSEKKVTLKQQVVFHKSRASSSQSSLDSRGHWRGASQESLNGPEAFTMMPTDSFNGPVMLNQHSRRSSRKSELAEAVLQSASPQLISQLEEDEQRRKLNGWKQLVKSPIFDFASAIAIIAFMVMLGAETNYTAKNRGQSTFVFLIGTFVFNIWFTVELVFRIAAERLAFFTSDEFIFNIIDALLVIVSVADLVLEFVFSGPEHLTGSVSMAKAVRVVRVLRAVRIVRLVRAMRYVYQLRKMICLIAGCFTTLFWCLIILFGFIFTFAVFFTQGVTDHLYEANVEEVPMEEILKLYYGTLPRSISSLFQSMSNGISWRDAFEPLGDVGVFYSCCFMMYMTLSLFGVVNVMTSVFVESTMKSALAYRDLITTDVDRMKKITAEHLQGVFRSIDLNRDGYISMEEMVYFMADPAICGYLEALDISLHDARALFQLLDSDASGFVDIDEFCDGCMRLKGDAKAFDVGCLICEMTRFFKRWSKFTEFAVNRFNRLERLAIKRQRRWTGYEWEPENQGIPPEPRTEIPSSQHVSSRWQQPSTIVTGHGTIGL